MLDQLTKESFAEQLDSTFTLTYEGSQDIEVELIEVEGRGMQPAPKRKWGVRKVRRDPFSLIFRGPHSPFLVQKMYPMQHEKMGALHAIFIVPVAQDEDGYYYEAVFS